MKSTILSKNIETPLGTMVACAIESGICLLEFTDRIRFDYQITSLKKLLKKEIVNGEHKYFHQLQQELNEYFSGERKQFDIPLHLVGTEFQQRVWKALLEIDYGKSLSYLQLSLKLGNKLAVRAVAAANGANKIALLVPCHRVAGSDGTLTGYAGGLWRKKYLLELEGNLPNGQIGMNF